MGHSYRKIANNPEIPEKPLPGIEKRIGKADFRALASAAKARNGRFSPFPPMFFPWGPIHEV
jgi:hypothetical protein